MYVWDIALFEKREDFLCFLEAFFFLYIFTLGTAAFLSMEEGCSTAGGDFGDSTTEGKGTGDLTMEGDGVGVETTGDSTAGGDTEGSTVEGDDDASNSEGETEGEEESEKDAFSGVDGQDTAR